MKVTVDDSGCIGSNGDGGGGSWSWVMGVMVVVAYRRADRLTDGFNNDLQPVIGNYFIPV